MVALFVKATPLKAGKEEYDRSLYRILNEETNQTLDQSLMKEAYKVKPQDIPDEEGEGEEEEKEEEPDEEEDDEEGEGDDEPKPEKLLLVGRIFRDEESNWMYEKYNYSFMESDKPDILKQLGEMEVESRSYRKTIEDQIAEERETMKKQHEREAEKLENNRKGQQKKGKRKSKQKEIVKEPTEEPDEEEEKEKK